MALRSISVVAMAAAAALPAQAQRVERISVVPSGAEQALRLGDAVLARPFGAQLVDRIAVVGSYRAQGRTYHLIRGEAAGDCPARFVVVTRTAEGAAPATTEPFGTCSAAARVQAGARDFIVSMPATVAGGAAVRFRYDQGAMRAIDPLPTATAAAAAATPVAPEASCRSAASVDPSGQAEALAEFEQQYPADYRRLKTLKRTQIAPDDLRTTVVGLACLARWPGAQDVVPRAATPLFASKRHGPAAFAVIDTIATDPASDANLRAAVRAFGAEMLYRVDRREPL